jgi:hypothetical protein
MSGGRDSSCLSEKRTQRVALVWAGVSRAIIAGFTIPDKDRLCKIYIGCQHKYYSEYTNNSMAKEINA